MKISKDIKYDVVARNALKDGVDQLSNAVATTLGPRGRNVIIENEMGVPHSTKDGVTVAKSIVLKDPVANLGATLVKEVAQQTAEIAGDGTTTATVLAQSLIHNGLRAINEGANPMDVRRGMEKTSKIIINALKNSSKDITEFSEIAHVGKISSNGDKEIGDIIATAMEKIGKEGILTVEESKSADTKLEIVEGMQFKRGYISPYFVTNQTAMKVELDDPYILLYDKKISSVKDIMKILEAVLQGDKQLLIIADDVDAEALATLVVNKVRGAMKVAAVKAPEFGDRRLKALEDIAAVIGTEVISIDKGNSLEDVTLNMLGRAKKVIIDNNETIIVDGYGKKEDIIERVNMIKLQLEDNSLSNYEKESLHERLAKLTNGIAVIHIGAETELELKERKDRLDDAINATKAALEEGIIPGGGVTFMAIYHNLINSKEWKEFKNSLDSQDEITGATSVLESLKIPFKKILNNAGVNEDVVWYDITNNNKKKSKNSGYDAQRNVVVKDMFEAGIIDPTKVARVALEKAISIASVFITTEAVIINNEDDIKEAMNSGRNAMMQQQYM